MTTVLHKNWPTAHNHNYIVFILALAEQLGLTTCIIYEKKRWRIPYIIDESYFWIMVTGEMETITLFENLI